MVVFDMLVVLKAIIMALEMIKVLMGMSSEMIVVIIVVEMGVVIIALTMVKVQGERLVVLSCVVMMIVFYMYYGRV